MNERMAQKITCMNLHRTQRLLVIFLHRIALQRNIRQGTLGTRLCLKNTSEVELLPVLVEEGMSTSSEFLGFSL